MSNIYYSPEKFGLVIVDSAELSSGSYEFDTTVLWKDANAKKFYVADDSGCSCPTPFDGLGRDDLHEIARLQDLIDYLEQRKRDSPYYYESNKAEIDGECASMIQAYRDAKKK